MKESVSFSGNEVLSTSLNFTELREKGIEYIQKLSGDIWTDYNSHDPGITILEQLCYALTDAAFRASLPIEDLLIPGKDLSINPQKNAFFTPSAIFSSHPVTVNDTRKMIIDRFDKIQNVWVHPKENIGFEEQLTGLNKIEILPKLSVINQFKNNKDKETKFLDEVREFLAKNRSVGENYNDIFLLEPQPIKIEFDVYIKENVAIEDAIAGLLLELLKYIYTPVIYSSFDEMVEDGYHLEEAFSGPRLTKGFIKDGLLNERVKVLYVEHLQKILSKVKGLNTCVVKPFEINGKPHNLVQVEKGKYFHLNFGEQSESTAEARFDDILEGMNIFVNNKKISSINKHKINYLFYESWSKVQRGYPIGKSLNEFFYNKLNGSYKNPSEYHSIQNHFPLIYGIGEQGLSKDEPIERQAKAQQLKTYLMLFEQHLANHLSQLGNINEFFNTDFEKGLKQTYFTQWMDSVPDVDKLGNKKAVEDISYIESEKIFFDRKNRIYNHLLARFGEELNALPWNVLLRLNIICSEKAFQNDLLQQKSKFLMRLSKLSYNRLKGEYFSKPKASKNAKEYKWRPSGLEEMICIKTGVSKKGKKSLIPDFIDYKWPAQKVNKDKIEERTDFDAKYKSLSADEISQANSITKVENVPPAMFGKIELKTLFAASLNYANYKISRTDEATNEVQVIFKKEPNKWVRLFECPSKENAIRKIGETLAYWRKMNLESEGFYLVDHILLHDFLKGSTNGYCYLDEYGRPLFHLNEKEPWMKLEERDEVFRSVKLQKEHFSIENGVWMIRHPNWKPIAFTVDNPDFAQLKSVISKETYIYADGELRNTKEEDSNQKSKKEKERIRIEKLTQIFDEIYLELKELDAPIKMALFRNFYLLNNDCWEIEYGERTLGSFKIQQEDIEEINHILEKQAFVFDQGKWSIQYDEKMVEGYHIEKENLVRLIAILKSQDYYFQSEKWKLKKKKTPKESEQWDTPQRDTAFFYQDNAQEFISDYDKSLNTLTRIFETTYQKNKSIIQLLNNKEGSGRMRLKEMEKIRLEGSKYLAETDFGQRRLVFQRKLANGKIINEDFFNLNISVVMPNWPARFQDKGFKAYFTDVLYERMPSHIGNKILWLHSTDLKEFEDKYFEWQNLRLQSKSTKIPHKQISSAAYELYNTLKQLQKNKK